MTVRFILGRAGSGKTRYCLEEMTGMAKEAAFGPPLLFLVPEQATFLAEKQLLEMNRQGLTRIRVLSFSRLASLLPPPKDIPPLNEAGRQVVLKKLLMENAGSLRFFAKAAKRPRFTQKLALQVKELKSYAVDPDALRSFKAADTAAGQALGGKLHDLALLYEKYLEFSAGRFADQEDLLAMLAVQVAESGRLAGASVWVDGYAGFTGLEYRVLKALMKTCRQVSIALCLDPEEIGRDPVQEALFFPTLDTYRRLLAMCNESGIEFLPAVRLPQDKKKTRFFLSPPLAHLEKQLFNRPPEPFAQNTGQVKIVEAANTRVEIEAIARDIIRNARDKKWRLREMAVLFRNLDPYLDIVSSVFREFSIPFFIDRKKDASHHPLVRLILHATGAVARGLPYDEVVPMLKTGFFPVSRYETDALENAALACGIRGDDWFDDERWERRLSYFLGKEGDKHPSEAAAGLKTILDKARSTFVSLFKDYYTKAKNMSYVAGHCVALYEFLEKLDVPERLQEWSKQGIQEGELEPVAIHRGTWREVTRALEQLWSILGDKEAGIGEFFQLLYSGLEGLEAGVVPPGVDQVLIGEVERSRQPDLKAVYLPGLCEGDFPARTTGGSLLADEERLELLGGGIELGVTDRQRLFNEQYLAYIAFTRASEYLYASYPVADGEGKAKRPSPLFNTLKKMFPENKVRRYDAEPEEDNVQDYLVGGLNTAGWLAAKMARAGDNPFWRRLYQLARDVPAMQNYLALTEPALRYKNASDPLPAELVDGLYPGPRVVSVSRLELYARCPFAHFARYGLRLADRKVFRLEPPDFGAFFHEALNQFVQEILAEGKDWPDLSEEEAVNRMERIFEEIAPRLKGEILLSGPTQRALSGEMKRQLASVAGRLAAQAQKSRFKPVLTEASFRFAVPLGGSGEEEGITVTAVGRIDRVDEALYGNKRYVRVIDYKRFEKRLDLGDLLSGLELQLFLYLVAVTRDGGREAMPAGAFFFPLVPRTPRLDNPPQEAGDLPGLRPDGLVLAEQEVLELMGEEELVKASLKGDGTFRAGAKALGREDMELVLQSAEKTAARLAGEIFSGSTRIAPYRRTASDTACRTCEYRSLCRFETRTGGMFRNLPRIGFQEALARIKAKAQGELT